MTARTTRSTMRVLATCATLMVLVMGTGIADAGLVKNETGTDANMMYLFWSIASIPAHHSICVNGLIDFPYFVCGGMNCPIPFFTSGTTVRISYAESGAITCCRDCIPNQCNNLDTTDWQGEKFDANQDGTISKDELSAAVAKAFEKADTNGDGLVSADELTIPDEVLSQIDRDGDGAISLDEATAFMLRLFEKTDSSGNGTLTKSEQTDQ